VQYEVGLKGELAARRVGYSVSVFDITRTDSATEIFTPGSDVSFFVNVGRQVHRGFEAEIIGEPIPCINIVGSYAFLDVDIKESGDPDQVGNTPPAAARHSASIFTTYEILEGQLRTLTMGGGVVYRSETEVDNVGTAQLPAFTRIDLRASYDVTNNFLVEFNVQNVFNEEIFTSSYGFPDLGIRYLDAREVSLRATYKW
jgi:outer membrane receptor protein involved in Fe transport